MNIFAEKKIWIGLGNPGREYARTYHNAGALALEALERTLTMTMIITKNGKTPLFEFKVFESDPSYRHGDRHRVTLVRPLVFMNQSGEVVAAALKYFRLKPANLLIFQDDSDLPLGLFRVSCNRGAGGHHGIESIVARLGTQDFCRVRIGVRPVLKEERGKTAGKMPPALELQRAKAGLPRRSQAKAGEFVLRPITAAHARLLQSVFGVIKKVMEKETP